MGYLNIAVSHVRLAWDSCVVADASGSTPEAPSSQALQHARRVATIHVPQAWPHGVNCSHCHGHFPCAPAQWGFGVLQSAGWELSDLFDLLENAVADEAP